MKFLHTSDIHIGAKFLSLGSKGLQQRVSIKQTFEKIVNTVCENNIDLLLISGDIFDQPYPSQVDIAFVKSLFLKLDKLGKWITVIAGNHDRMENGSVWLQEHWKEIKNLIIFSSNCNHFYIDSLNTHLYANSIYSQFSENNPLEGIRVTVKKNKTSFPNSHHIVLAHGGIDIGQKSDNYLMKKNELASLGADYVALGDWHSLLLVNSRSKELTDYIYSEGSSPTFYSGSPEMVDLNQSGSGHIIIGEFIGNELHIKNRKIGMRVFDTVNIQLELFTLDKLISEILKVASLEMIKVVNLQGFADFDLNIEELKEVLEHKFWKLEINAPKGVRTLNKIFEPGTVAYEFTVMLRDEMNKTQDVKELQILNDALDEGLRYLHG